MNANPKNPVMDRYFIFSLKTKMKIGFQKHYQIGPWHTLIWNHQMTTIKKKKREQKSKSLGKQWRIGANSRQIQIITKSGWDIKMNAETNFCFTPCMLTQET